MSTKVIIMFIYLLIKYVYLLLVNCPIGQRIKGVLIMSAELCMCAYVLMCFLILYFDNLCVGNLACKYLKIFSHQLKAAVF